MKRLLLVDDSEDMRVLVKEKLKAIHAEVEVVEATNGLAALEILRQETFDVILTDLQMPEMDGEYFVRNARDKGVINPIYMYSSNPPNRPIEGIDRFFLKSRELNALIELLAKGAV